MLLSELTRDVASIHGVGPALAERLGRELASRLDGLSIETVSSPAIGGIVLGQEVARALPAGLRREPVRAIFAERDSAGILTLRRGFSVAVGERIAVIEDVWTTGGSTREAIGVVEQEGGLAVAAGAIIDRSGGRLELNVTARALLEMEVPSYEPDDCPQCHAGGTATRPGSRFSRSQP